VDAGSGQVRTETYDYQIYLPRILRNS
jgi:hypothetical protein